MDQSREQILADFQACTGIEDVSLAIQHLDDTNWVLVDAVNHMLALNEVDADYNTNSSAGNAGDQQHASSGAANAATDSIDLAAATAASSAISDAIATAAAPFVPQTKREQSVKEANRFLADREGEHPMAGVIGTSVDVDEGTSATKASNKPANQGGAAANMNLSFPTSHIRTLEFFISYNDRDTHILLDEDNIVGMLKQMCQAEFSIPPCHQRLIGWQTDVVEDGEPDLDVVLMYLRLPEKNRLVLLSTAGNSVDGAEMSGEGTSMGTSHHDGRSSQQQIYKLHITDTDNEHTYILPFEGSKTIREVKHGVYTLTNVAVRNQQWTGWPTSEHLQDNLTLAASGIKSEHHLTVCSKPAAATHHLNNKASRSSNHHSQRAGSSSSSNKSGRSHRRHKKSPVKASSSGSDKSASAAGVSGAAMSSSDSDEEEYDDESAAMLMESVDDDDLMLSRMDVSKQSGATTSLIPDGVDDEVTASELFHREFETRYGENHPVFYIGTLEEALQHSCHTAQVKDRKLLALYLHHDGSVLSNVFCSHTLCADSIVQYLAQHFIVWPWDVTLENNKNRLLQILGRQLGVESATMIRRLTADHYPIILIIMKHRGNIEVYTTCQGNTLLDELMSTLLNAVDVFDQRQEIDLQEEKERDARQHEKSQQDVAYEESLLADKLKEEQRKAEREQQLAKELEDQFAEADAKRKEEEQEQAVQAIKQSLAESLPAEPPEDGEQALTVIRIKTPGGETFERRFLATDTLHTLLNYVRSKGFPTDEFKVLRSWPRTDMTGVDETQSLLSLKMVPQETLVLTEKD